MKKIQLSNRLFFEGLTIIFALLVIGTINLYSALSGPEGVNLIFYRHLVWLGLGAVIALMVQFLNPAYIENVSAFFFLFCCVLLLVVLFAGKRVYGAQRWLTVGFITFQPSELIKLAMIFYLAKYFRHIPTYESGYRLQQLAFPILIAFLPALLVLKQPDLGTAIIILVIAFLIFLMLGINSRLLSWCSTLFLTSTPLIWFLLHDYQRRRITAFISPESDPRGSGYQTIQAKIAIGTGGFYGKGFLNGVQSKLGFIPEKHTDFVFSVFAEEWGFVGVSLFIILFTYLLFWMFKVVRNIQDRFLFLSGAGIVFLFATHFVINLAMVAGLFPVVGVPLPLFSYGGSALLINMVSLSFLLKLSREY